MIIPMLCVTIFVILVVWFLLPRVARLMIHTPTAISILECLSMVQLLAVLTSPRSPPRRRLVHGAGARTCAGAGGSAARRGRGRRRRREGALCPGRAPGASP